MIIDCNVLPTHQYIGDKRVKYGLNNNGDYVPISIGGEKVHYGFNVKGDYVPISIGNRRVKYGLKGKGEYVIKEIE